MGWWWAGLEAIAAWVSGRSDCLGCCSVRDAIAQQHPRCLRYLLLHDRGTCRHRESVGPEMISLAAYQGDMACLKELMTCVGLQQDTGAICTAAAACGGRRGMACLQFALDSGCCPAGAVCYLAARHGDLEMLEYARARGCPWDERTCWEAARAGELDVLRWAAVHGCPWRRHECLHLCEVDRVVVRMQRAYRHWRWRHDVLHNPGTEIGRLRALVDHAMCSREVRDFQDRCSHDAQESIREHCT